MGYIVILYICTVSQVVNYQDMRFYVLPRAANGIGPGRIHVGLEFEFEPVFYGVDLDSIEIINTILDPNSTEGCRTRTQTQARIKIEWT